MSLLLEKSKHHIAPLMILLGCALFFVLSIATFWSQDVQATAETAPPSVITYQGRLFSQGLAVTTTQTMAFELYDAATAGTLLYTASGTLTVTSTLSITPSSGIFTVDLGGSGTNAVTTSIFSDNTDVYLQVVVGGTSLSPRRQLTTAPFAMNSRFLMGAVGATTSGSTYVPISDTVGNFVFQGQASSSAVSGGLVYVNATSTEAEETLFGVAVNGIEKFRVDEDGDAFVAGQFMASGTANIDSGTFYVDASTNRVGVNSTTPYKAFGVVGDSYFVGTTTIEGGLDFNAGIGLENLINFGAGAKFVATGGLGPVYIFDTSVNTPSSTDSYVFSIRNDGASLFSVSTNGDAKIDGNIFASSTVIGTPGAPGDLAERVDIALDHSTEPGDVMVVDPRETDQYKLSEKPYEQAVAGVISTNPSIVVGNGKTDHTAQMALTGRLPVKVTDENGPISRGDLLVSASKIGHAMKYDPENDDGVRVVGVIGMALENFEHGSGKIMGLVKTGWVQNRNQTIAGLQEDLVVLAEQEGVPAAGLNVAENDAGKLVRLSGDLDANDFSLINVNSIVGTNNAWHIDEGGRFVTRVSTDEGDASLYAVQSAQTEYMFSGSGQLDDGTTTIHFDELTQALIDKKEDINVSVTLTSMSKSGIYIQEKDHKGFTVLELNGGQSEATFDWVVIAKRKIGDIEEIVVDDNEEEMPAEEEPVQEEPEVPVEEESPVEELPIEEEVPDVPVEEKEPPQDDPPVEEPVEEVPPPVEEEVPAVEEEPVAEPEPVVDEPEVPVEELPAAEPDPVVDEPAQEDPPAEEPTAEEPPPVEEIQ